PTLTRPWIVPGEIIVRESQDSAYIYKATLKVMLEEDYLNGYQPSAVSFKQSNPNHQPLTSNYTFSDPRLKELNQYSTQLIKELIIPKLTQEVNSNKRYAKLRQAYYSLVLSRWFKMRFTGKSGQYADLIDRHDLTNLTSKEPYDKLTYFKQYQESFAQGEYNLKEPVYTPYGQSIRSYMSGGFSATDIKFSGSGTKTAGSPAEQQLLKTKDMVIFDESLEPQPLALAASPVSITIEDLEKLNVPMDPDAMARYAATRPPLQAGMSNLLNSIFILGHEIPFIEDVSRDRARTAGHSLYVYCNSVLRHLKIIISDETSRDKIDEKVLNDFLTATDEKSKQVRIFVKRIKEFITVYDNAFKSQATQKAGSPLRMETAKLEAGIKLAEEFGNSFSIIIRKDGRKTIWNFKVDGSDSVTADFTKTTFEREIDGLRREFPAMTERVSLEFGTLGKGREFWLHNAGKVVESLTDDVICMVEIFPETYLEKKKFKFSITLRNRTYKDITIEWNKYGDLEKTKPIFASVLTGEEFKKDLEGIRSNLGEAYEILISLPDKISFKKYMSELLFQQINSVEKMQSKVSAENVLLSISDQTNLKVALNDFDSTIRSLILVESNSDVNVQRKLYNYHNYITDVLKTLNQLNEKLNSSSAASPIEFYNEQEAEQWVKENFKTGSISKYEYLLIPNEDFVEMGELAKSIIQTIPKEIDIFQASGKMAYGIPQTKVPLFHQKNYTIQPEVKGKPRVSSISSEDWREVIIDFWAFIVMDVIYDLTAFPETKKLSLEKDAAIIFGEDKYYAFKLTLEQWWGKKYLPGYKLKELTEKQRAFFQKYFSVSASLLTIPKMRALGLTPAQDFIAQSIIFALHNIDVRATLETTPVRGLDSTEGRARSLLEACKKYMLEFPEKYIQVTKIKISKKEIEEITGTLSLYFDPWFTARPENIATAAGYLSRVMRDKFEEGVIAEGFRELQQKINSIVENLLNKSDENKALGMITLDKLIMELAVFKRETKSHSAEEWFSKLIELMSRVNEKDTEFKCEIIDEIFFILTYRVEINNIASYALNSFLNVHRDMFKEYEPEYPTISKVLDAIKEGLKEDRLEILKQLKLVGWNKNQKISLQEDIERIERFIATVTNAQKNKDSSSSLSISPLTNGGYVVNGADREKISSIKRILSMFPDDGKKLIERYPDFEKLYEETEEKLKTYWKTEETYDIQKAAEAALEFYAAFTGILPGGSNVEPEIENKIKTLRDTDDIIKGAVEKIKSLIEKDIKEFRKIVNTEVDPNELDRFLRELSLKNSKATVTYILFLLSGQFKPYHSIPGFFIEESKTRYDAIKTELEIFDFPAVSSPVTNNETTYIIDSTQKERMRDILVIIDRFKQDAQNLVSQPLYNPEYNDLKILYEKTQEKLIRYWETRATYDIQKTSDAVWEFYAAVLGIQFQKSNIAPDMAAIAADVESKCRILQDARRDIREIIADVIKKMRGLLNRDMTAFEETKIMGSAAKDEGENKLEELEEFTRELNFKNLRTTAQQMGKLFNDLKPQDYEKHREEWYAISKELEMFYYSRVASPVNRDWSAYNNSPAGYGGIPSFDLTVQPSASSSLQTIQKPAGPLGGIDFTDRAMRIGLEPMGSFADLKLVLPQISNVAAIDLDNEFKQIQIMATSGIRPADTRILEFAAACYYRGEFSLRLGEITACLQQAHFLDERSGRESSPALRLATMLPEVLHSRSLN
ncbi:MAG: hypothetical protein Q7J72_04705, partial [Candidatus Omnitrophota bacterium]|nr:hypothetical protein [Candidatus Omnitrophota bacterium]